jgi:putative ABC transport system permease protein
MIQDVRYAVRAVRRQPGMALTSIVSLSVGLAAVAGAISALDALGFRPQAIARPESLVRIQSVVQGGSAERMSYLDFDDLRGRTRTPSALAAYGVKGAGLSGPEAPPEIGLMNVVTADYFTTLGVMPAIGRPLDRQDAAPGAAPAVVISWRTWQRRFHGDPDVLRRTIQVNGTACAIVGVLPRSFTGLDAFFAPDVWMPIAQWAASGPRKAAAPEVADRTNRWLTVFGRLDASLGPVERVRDLFGHHPPAIVRAQAEMDVAAAALRAAYPVADRDQRLVVVSDATARQHGMVPTAILLLLIVAVVIGVGCANAAGLMLGRAESRRKEMGIRVALGAKRVVLVRQVLLEAAVIAFGAIVGGLLLGAAVVRSLPLLLPPISIPLVLDFRLDARVVLVTAAVAAMTIFAFGLWPAFVSSRYGISNAVRNDSTTAGLRRLSLRNALVAGQVAVSVVLLVCGMLFVRGLRSTRDLDVGFAQRPLLLATLAPAAAGYDQPRTAAFFRDLVERLSSAPGIRAVSLARRVPLDPNGGGATRDVIPPDRTPGHDERPLHIRYNSVLPNYFSVMGTRILRGRAFVDADRATAPKVVIINEAMAAKYWPNGDALGGRVRIGGGAGDYQIVGIAQDGKYNQLTEAPQPYMFFAIAQAPVSEATLIVDAGPNPGSAAATVRNALQQMDPHMPTLQMLTLAQHLRFASYPIRMAAIAVGALGSSGLLLSVVGLYSVISFLVARRTREIGIRMAIGASPGDIRRAVMRHALLLAAAGGALGALGAFALAQLLAGSLYGVSPSDPVTFTSVLAGVVAVSLLASWAPARRAMRVDPMVSLRAE